ncbi:hypothetical protein ATKI12_1824 [Kitasatospora sp. Ki12]
MLDGVRPGGRRVLRTGPVAGVRNSGGVTGTSENRGDPERPPAPGRRKWQ